jgi:hypothetical protein
VNVINRSPSARLGILLALHRLHAGWASSLASVGFPPSRASPLGLRRLPPSRASALGLRRLLPSRASALGLRRLYAGGAKTLQLQPPPPPHTLLFRPPFGADGREGREAQSRLGSRKFRLRRASPTGGSSSNWKNPGTVPEFSIGAARSIRCVANGQARGLRLGGSRG